MKPIIKHKNSLKNMDTFTIYALARNALTESGNKTQLDKMNVHLKEAKSKAETLKIIQQYVTFERN